MKSYAVFKFAKKSTWGQKPLYHTDNSKHLLSWCYSFLKEHPRTKIYVVAQETGKKTQYIDIMWADVEGKKRIIAYGTRAYTINPDGTRDRFLKDVTVFKVEKGKAGLSFRFEYEK